ncbi:MAG: RNA polymerase sigma factor [Vallitalea sp.]|jgi:RNA polymerase sigma-70 factor (ECF subfamily)|nr:RNA polymerase sigma factor [Vallitalea sp.]
MTDFEDIYSLYYNDVYKYVLSLCHNPSFAEDITHDTFIKAIKSIDTYREQCKFKVWLCQIAKNHYFTLYKKNKLQRPEDIEMEMENLENKLVVKETALEVHKALHSLQEPYKEVFSLRIFGELSFYDIGMLFEKTENWARVTFYRAKIKIKEEIK